MNCLECGLPSNATRHAKCNGRNQMRLSAAAHAVADDALLAAVKDGYRPTDLANDRGISRVRAGVIIRRARERAAFRKQDTRPTPPERVPWPFRKQDADAQK